MAHPRISFVTTANQAIGTGHLRRCLTLSAEFTRRGVEVQYWVYHGDPQLRRWLSTRSETATIAPELTLERAIEEASGNPIAVVDTYDSGKSNLAALLARGVKTLVMDDLADRILPATWLLNSCVREPARYAGLTQGSLLLGPQYALLRPQFRSLPKRVIAEKVTKVLLTFGGSDILNLRERILRLLDHDPDRLHIRVVSGALSEINRAESHHEVEVFHDVENMADLMCWADIAITAAGQTGFELAATGCPALCLRVADNQQFTGDLFSELGVARVCDARTITDEGLRTVIRDLFADYVERKKMAEKGPLAIDGRGVERVADTMLAAI